MLAQGALGFQYEAERSQGNRVKEVRDKPLEC
jgi:hypothetical protein